ncbi:hypothetical protein ACOMHN_038297 [Nucella lapillus]
MLLIWTHGSPVAQRDQHPTRPQRDLSPPRYPRTAAGPPEGRKTGERRNKEEDSRTENNPSPSEAQNATSKDDDGDQLVTETLLKYGYFRQGKPLSLLRESTDAGRTERAVPSQNEALAEAVRRFQSFFGLAVTGVVDKETITLMKKSRCGVADIPEDRPHHMTADSQSPSDYTLLGTKWHTNSLTWRLKIPSNQLSRNKQRQTMEDAFAMWTEVAPLEFQQLSKSTRGPVDINIEFGTGSHGDKYPFDGKGKVLAHAFGPGEVGLSGDMHLDDDEKWTVGPDQDTNDLFLVATHELGHSLGLAHSRDPSSLMYPYYGYTDTLGQDDIRAIQSLYGVRIDKPSKPRRKRPTTTTTTTTAKPATHHHSAKSAVYFDESESSLPRGESPVARCNIQFDAVFRDDSRQPDVYTGIQGDSVHRFNQRGLINGYPSTLNKVYPGAPSNADAVFGMPEKSATYFIKGLKVWRYTNSRLDSSYPKKLKPSHFYETVRFVLPVVDASGIQRLFVFGRTRWMEYNFDSLPSYTPNTYVISKYWPDVATDVIYAVTGYDSHIYVVSPHSHVVLNSFRRAVHGGKKEGSPDWLKPVCHVASGSSLRTIASASLLTVWTVLAFVLGKC